MELIDTHCHLYAKEFESDCDEVVKRAEQAGVKKFFLPAIDRSSLDAMLSVEAKYPGECFSMMGLHPCSVKEDFFDELEIVESWLKTRKFVAIGEIGLDFYWDKTFKKEQERAFRIQIEWALAYNLPVVIHTREAMQETISLVKEYKSNGVRGIFHCFGGSYTEAKEIIDLGFYLGIGGVITYKNSGLGEVVAKINLDSLVLETDAPYLAPVPFRGKRNESCYLLHVAHKIAEVKRCSVEEVAKITTQNAEKIFY